MASEHYGTVAKVAHARGLIVYGEALEDGRPSLGDDIAMRSHTDILHRRLEDGDAYYVDNRRARTESVEARFRVTGKEPEIWRADTGKREPVSHRIENGEAIVPLEIGPEDSFFVVFRKPATADSRTVATPAWKTAGTLGNPWTVAFQPDRGAPVAAITLSGPQSLSESGMPG